MLSQVRSGALDIFTVGSPLANVVPVSSISSIAFAFPDFAGVWAAVDGDLGAHIRQQIGSIGLVAFDKMWDNGFRQITTSNKPINTPDDLKGLKLRVPVSPLFTSMFRALGTSPTAINFVEVYTALQTKIVDGQENPLALIEAAKFYEVQKYCSLTGHMWEGFWMVANRKTWEQLPQDLRDTTARLLNEGAVKQREDMAKLNTTLEAQLKDKGLTFNTVDKKPFQQALKAAGFYGEWRQKYGEDAWKILEKYSGNLT
jgi:tripartite ATP-independent transporter DctP family solute receptor